MANKGMPSLLALLGLVAVAGYQNRDKLRDMIGDARDRPRGRRTRGAASRLGRFLDEISSTFGSGGNSGRNLKDGLTPARPLPLNGRATRRTRGSRPTPTTISATATSRGPSATTPIEELARRTGLSRGDSGPPEGRAPRTVNRLTPDGRLPSESEAQGLI